MILPTPRFFDLVNHWITDEFIWDTRADKHRIRRDELNDRFIGYLTYAEGEPEVEVKPKHGIRRPSWFREAITVGDIEMTAASFRR